MVRAEREQEQAWMWQCRRGDLQAEGAVGERASRTLRMRDAGLAQCSEELGKLQCRITELDQVSKHSPALACS